MEVTQATHTLSGARPQLSGKIKEEINPGRAFHANQLQDGPIRFPSEHYCIAGDVLWLFYCGVSMAFTRAEKTLLRALTPFRPDWNRSSEEADSL